MKNLRIYNHLALKYSSGLLVQKHCMSINHLITITADEKFVSKYFRKNFGSYSTFLIGLLGIIDILLNNEYK